MSLLHGVAPTDPPPLIAVACVLLAAAGLAGYLLARRASRIHPVAALRQT